MKGLRIRDKFSALLAPIAQHVSEYFWALDAVTFAHQGAGGRLFDERKYNDAILQWGRPLVLMDKHSLLDFAEFIQGDWDAIYGLSEPVELAALRDCSYDSLPEAIEVFFPCTDTAYWEVYARDEELLRLMKRAYPEAGECSLEEKRRHAGSHVSRKVRGGG
jgi:hypothetical protein